MIAILDVYYKTCGARAACVLAEHWQSEKPNSCHITDIASVEEYIPGQFFRRELPCLMSVLDTLPTRPDFVIVDGYVWLPDSSGKGLGAHLYEHLGSDTPVVGVAKTSYRGAESSPLVVPVRRGQSDRPLFVTAAGIDCPVAAPWIQQMAGPNRIPSLIKIVDQLSRSE